MTEPQINAAPEAAPPVSIADMSLADYRAQRERPAAAPVAHETSEPSAEGSTEPEESAAQEHADDTPEHESEEKAEEKATRRKGGWQRKIDKAEREIEALKAQLAGKPAETATKAPETNAAPQFDKAKPRIADFDSLEAFTEALSDWKSDERDFKRAQADAQAKAHAEQQQILSDWNSRKTEAQEKHSDYDEVLESASDVKLTPAHQRLFLESEAGAELAYQLAKDPSELKKFAEMDALRAARYFGKLEASFDTTPKQETKTVSNAPKPIRPVGARANTNAAPPDLAKISLADYRRLRESGRIGRAA
jgi:hypothetical protein